ncbi:ABC transporter ATP-binding protein [Alkalihalobacillus sp. AL-G]|uniref:ABC transporter ATP-binding protein n=1 Tax=Alkalihalobacillus sp. AL-G TaxID=2926399 RepID=UPI00272B03DB|nr:ABC transporter ATP-binding protein [Alkalihalobacillus sp. AL-G]WLD94660.1 ABC transporter ATP-binding protein [Alkalihalobacillus sp. AL-G]
MLEAKGITKTYTVKQKAGLLRSKKQPVHAVKGIDLTIHPGEIVGLLGLNGAGKTTTIKMLSTLLTPSSGTISIDGYDVVQNAKYLKQKVNMIAGGERMLYFRLTGKENLDYFGRLYGLKGKQLASRVNILLNQVELENAKDMPVERYSKGMKQRLQIARGLLNEPKYLFLDEPTLGLDAPIARQLRSTVRNLAKQEHKGILLTSHYLEEVEELCDRVYIIDKGEVIMHDSPARIVGQIVTDYRVVVSTTILPDEMQQRMFYTASNKQVQLAFELTEEGSRCEAVASFDPTQVVIDLFITNNLPILKMEMKLPKLEDAILQLAKERSA